MSELAETLGPFIEAAHSLRGWELEYEPRPLDPEPDWDYGVHAREIVRSAATVLDLGTGGGEVFAQALADAPSGIRAVATEAWPPNGPVAARRLRGRASVLRSSSLVLPFPDRSFECVLNRHEELDPAEVLRVLTPGGRLLTQQVHPEYWPELREFLPGFADFPRHDRAYPRELEAGGAEIEILRSHRHRVSFDALGPLVYHLIACPWNLPGFDLAAHAGALAELDSRIQRDGSLVLSEGHYLLQARALA